MSNIILPTILQGPAYVVHGGVTTFLQAGAEVALNRNTWNPESALGAIGERLKSNSATLSATPVGMLTKANCDYYYANHISPSTKVGKSLLLSALVIVDMGASKSYTYAKGALTKAPNLHLGPGKTAFGSMEFVGIGDPAVQPLTAAQLKISETVVGSLDTGFEESSIVTDIYKAALGADSTPFNGMGSMDGFDIDFPMTIRNIEAGDVGIADIVLAGLGIGVSFAPSNLTEANVDTLLRIDGTEALLPGQEIARGLVASAGTPKDLVVTGTQSAATFTAKVVGCKDAGYTYQIGVHRHKGLKFVNSRRWATGAETALFAHSLA